MGSEVQDAWVARVLGVVMGSQATPAGADEDYLALFRDAKDAVDVGLSKLADSMRETEDEDFIRIADRGLYGLTNGEGVGLMKALFEVQRAPADQRGNAISKMRGTAAAYKKAVFDHPLSALVDENPFGVEVGLRSKLGAALDKLAAG